MKEKLIKLIDVKSIITLTLTLIFSVLSLTAKLSAEQFQTVFSTVIAFYFGTQKAKNSKEERK
ncbi:MAG: hypothetical protein J6A30_08565 [Ruminococcus sp.]|nr:hypothetical protein [Ruminococcus sp.]MBP3309409.1 hypothetical protein [Ruminococcus sp.]